MCRLRLGQLHTPPTTTTTTTTTDAFICVYADSVMGLWRKICLADSKRMPCYYSIKRYNISYIYVPNSICVLMAAQSLAWRKIRQASGEPMWYNWAINATQIEQPDELSKEMIAEVRVERCRGACGY